MCHCVLLRDKCTYNNCNVYFCNDGHVNNVKTVRNYAENRFTNLTSNIHHVEATFLCVVSCENVSFEVL